MDAPHGRWQNAWRKVYMETIKECYELFWTKPGSNTPQNAATYLPSQKSDELEKQGQNHKRLSFMDPNTWTHQCWPICKDLQLCMDIGCGLEDLPEAMGDRDNWRENVREICSVDATWWWWWWGGGGQASLQQTIKYPAAFSIR